MVFKSVEISTPVAKPRGIVASHRGRCNCGCRPDSRSPCIRCWHGIFGRVRVEQCRHIGEHIPDYHRSLPDCRRDARLCHWGVTSPGVCVQNGLASIPTKSSSATQLMAFWHGHSPRSSAPRFWRRRPATSPPADHPGLAPASNVAATAGSGGPLDYYVDALLRPDPAVSPNTTDAGAARREIADILTKGLGDGDVAGPDRTYVAQVVAARTGLSQADADKRVSIVIDQAKTDLDTARKAAANLLCGSPPPCLPAPLLPVWRPRKAEKSEISTRVLRTAVDETEQGGNYRSWNSALPVGSSHSDHYSSCPLAALVRRGVRRDIVRLTLFDAALVMSRRASILRSVFAKRATIAQFLVTTDAVRDSDGDQCSRLP